MLIFTSIIFLLVLSVFIFMHLPKFGRLPFGVRLERIKESPNYRKGSFKNLSPTPNLAEGATFFGVLKDFINKTKHVKPLDIIPSQKTDLLTLDPNENALVWFGHSSYFMQIDGKKILVDPVFSGAASPLAFTTRAFRGTDRYTTEDLPNIDYLFITHDHWDHLDYKTISAIRTKVKRVITGLGTGQHLERWGYRSEDIIEKDWNENIILDQDFTAHTTPARHFSGRGFRRDKALWTSFVLSTPSIKIFIGGDSGYDTHFAKIGKDFGAFDLVILENGQYNKSWKYIHMLPADTIQAAKDLNAKVLLPVHSSKFALALHAWDEPLKAISKLSKTEQQKIITPMIGEKVNLDNLDQEFSEWWAEIK